MNKTPLTVVTLVVKATHDLFIIFPPMMQFMLSIKGTMCTTDELGQLRLLYTDTSTDRHLQD